VVASGIHVRTPDAGRQTTEACSSDTCRTATGQASMAGAILRVKAENLEERGAFGLVGDACKASDNCT
jgi:hypothetical protein